MDIRDYELEKINHAIESLLRNNELNFCEMVSQPPGTKLSVTAESISSPERRQRPMGSCDCYTLDENLHPTPCPRPETFYYGVSPELSSSALIEIVSKQLFSTCEGLQNYLRENGNLFMLHAAQLTSSPDESKNLNESKNLEAVAADICISLASNFGIRILADGEINSILDSQSSLVVKKAATSGIKYYKLCGCLPKGSFDSLKDVHFVKETADEITYWKRCTSQKDNSVSFWNIYNDPYNIELLNGAVFYSGVLLRMLEMQKLDNHFQNDKVCSLHILFEKSSYGTVFTMDNNFTDHPILTETYGKTLKDFFAAEDCRKRKMQEKLMQVKPLEGEQQQQDILNTINLFLRTSSNVNQIGVSCNLISRDGILIFGLRQGGSIDEGTLYPGVNGNTELKDRKVEFYRHSMYEDYPTISEDDMRIDFYDELRREAYAELKIDLPTQNFSCLGVTVSGNIPPESVGKDEPNPYKNGKKRRMHFNICFEIQAEEDFLEILNRQKSSTEAFENKDMVGYKISFYSGIWSMAWTNIKAAMQATIESRDIFEVLILGTFVAEMGKEFIRELSASNFGTSILSVGKLIGFKLMHFFSAGLMSVIGKVISVFILIISVSKLRSALEKWWNYRSLKKKFHIFKKKSAEEIDHILQHSLDKNRHVCHPVTLAMLRAYVVNHYYDHFLDTKSKPSKARKGK